MKAIFLKSTSYKGKQYNKNDIIEMSEKDFKAFKEFFLIDYAIKYNSENKANDMSYRNLQKMCKDKNLYAVGTKEELIKRLNLKD